MYECLSQGAVNVIRGDLPLTADHVQQVERLLQQCLNKGQPYAVLDLGKVPLVDSAGLELLLDFRDAFQQVGGTLKLAAPNPLCREILSITGLAESFDIFPEVLSAVGSFVR